MGMSPEEIIDAKSRLYGGLDGVLQPGEHIVVIIDGPAQQAIVGTDLRLFVYKSGNKAGANWRRRIMSWAYGDVAEIRVFAGPHSGAITVIPVRPDPAIEGYWATDKASAQQAPNAISLASPPGSLVESRVDVLRAMVANARAAGPAAAVSNDDSPAELADDIRQLAALRDQGLLTEDEFRAKKAQLLERF